MKIKCQLREINYGDAAVKVLPMLAERSVHMSAGSQLLRAAAGLPEDLLRQVVEAIPEEERKRILSTLMEEKKDRVLTALRAYGEREKLGLTISDFSLDENMNAEICIARIDPVVLADKLVPMLKSRGGSLGLLAAMPIGLWAGFLGRMTQKEVQEYAVGLLNQMAGRICLNLTNALMKNGIRGRVTGFRAEA